MDIASLVEQQIKEQNIKPIPKNVFVVRHILVWSAVAGTVVLTGVASGIMVYLLSGHEWGVGAYTGESLPKQVVRSLPYFWLLVASVLLGLSVVNSRWLRRGYSVRPIVYFGLYGAVALLLGVVISETGVGGQLEEQVAPHIPAYEALVSRPEQDLYRPEQGLMAGHLVITPGVSEIDFSDCKGGMWILDDSQAKWLCGAEKNTGEHVKLIGSMSSRGAFSVDAVVPWNVMLSGIEKCTRNRALAP
jgi:hypothetical protein